MKTTLSKIRKHSPCESGWKKLLAYLEKTKADDETLSIKTVLESNGLGDALWCLRAVDGHDREIRLFSVWCARQVQHLMTDQRSLDALDVAERFANGQATEKELEAASDAAWDAASATAWAAASATAWAAASATARAAAWAAAAWAASTATSTAASTAATWDAEDAAWAARDAQKSELIRICDEIEKGGAA